MDEIFLLCSMKPPAYNSAQFLGSTNE